MKKIGIVLAVILVLLFGWRVLDLHKSPVREGWTAELCAAADGLMKCEREVPKSDNPGIVVMKKGYIDGVNRVEISLVNAKTGKSKLLAEFCCRPGQAINAPIGACGNLRDAFTEDYSKMAATAYVDGLAHAGWVDQTGTFTDVTEALGLECVRDESYYVDYGTFGFSGNDFYYFKRAMHTDNVRCTGDEFYHVPVDIRPEAVSAVSSDDQYVYFWENIYNGAQTWSKTEELKMEPSMVIDGRYVLSDYGEVPPSISTVVVNNLNCVITTPEQAIPIFAKGTGDHWNPILSPDNKRICCLQRSCEDGAITLCVVSLKTGETSTLETGDLLSDVLDDANESILYMILDWR